jgi:hypothetical protein
MGSLQQALLMTGAAGAPAFSPTDISGITLWLKADAITGKVDGDLLSQWDDSSGAGNHVTASGALRPTYKTGIENGLPAVLFSGAQYLIGPSRDTLIDNDKYAIFVVAKVTDYSLAANQYFVAEANNRLLLWTDTTGNLKGQMTNAGGTFDFTMGAPTDGALTQFDVRHYPAGFADTRRHQYKRLGDTAVGNSALGNFTSTGGTDLMYFGGRVGISRYLTGYIMEVICYAAGLSDADRTNVRNFLAAKWGYTYS